MVTEEILMHFSHMKTNCLQCCVFCILKVQVPAEVTKIGCGVDHMVVLSKSFA